MFASRRHFLAIRPMSLAPIALVWHCHRWTTMIANDQQLEVTLQRIAWFQRQIAHLRKTETNPANYRAAASGFLAELDRMQLEVREYFSQPATS